MGNELVSEAEVEKALDFLRDWAKELGAAVEEARYREHMVKVTLAFAMKEKSDLPVNAQEREARTSQSYLDACKSDAQAAGKLATLKALREAAALKLEVWRSASANYRSMKL